MTSLLKTKEAKKMKYITNHAQQRMNQRGIKSSMIDLTLEHGEFDERNRCVLTKQNAIELMTEFKDTLKILMKVIDKGGLVVIEDAGKVITTYNYNH
jgi:hypothetical protein